ncbi:MAG: 2Fe-2S iron-sulfur cluster binding domain-containing protein [Deltaproteobacteria bacterium]|nr:2Fe-2S iron-sulfur cluster binding domain-containing protein [Deltaproteobacteria bacterium]
MVNLTIDGRAIQSEPGKTLLEVAKEHGIFIPYLCYHPALKPIGSCRICVVEVKPGPPRPLPACATYVAEGQEVVTESPRLRAIRQELMKLVLINHALDCPICDKGGECELQELTHALGVGQVDLEAQPTAPNIDYVSRLIERHPDRCVTCGRCVHICRDHVGAMAINFMHRGYFTELGSGLLPLDCEFCGSCVDICPVGALINKTFKYRARAWEVERAETVCPFCGGGCTYQVHTRDGQVVRVVNEDSVLLCGRGRFGFPVLTAEDRLRTPLIKENGAFREADWEEALDLAARRLKEIIEEKGPGAVYGVGSPRATNEANYLFQKFFRAGLGTNQVDNPARYHYVRALEALAEIFGWPQVEGAEAGPRPREAYASPLTLTEAAKGKGFSFVLGTIEDLPKADLALVVGMDVTPELPPLGWAINEASLKDDFKLIVANPRLTKFDRNAALSLRYAPGSERLLAAGLIKALLTAHPDWTPAIPAQGLEEFKEALKKATVKEMAKKTGVDEALLKEAAELLAQAKAPAIIFGAELLAQDKGGQNALALADLFLLVGQPEAPGSRLYPVAEKANTRGVCEVGVLPDRLPGLQPLTSELAAKIFAPQAPASQPGLTLPEVLDRLEADAEDAPQALYALGGDFLRWLPHRSRTEKVLQKLSFMVVQDAFLTDTAKLADVVLPVAVFVEQEGTFLSSDGRLGVSSRVLSPIGVKPDWQIISELGRRLGFPLKYSGPAAIFQEMAPAMPLWAGAAPRATVPAAGFAAAPAGRFVPFDLDISLPGRRPYVLIVGKSLQHSGSFTTHQPCGTLVVTPGAALELHPEDAAALNLAAGDSAKVISSYGEVTAPVALSADLPPGVVLLAEHFGEPAAHTLTLNSNLVRVSIQKA